MRLKKTFVAVLLSAVAAWGLIHPMLVYLYDMNPWKLFGMAMYCVPSPSLAAIHFADASGGGRRLIPFPERVPERERTKQTRYLSLRSHTGSLVPPTLLAEHAFGLHPEMTRLEIVIVHWAYSLDESRMVKHSDGYVYERTGSSSGAAGVRRVVN